MNGYIRSLTALGLLASCLTAPAQLIIIEPDDFAEFSVLDRVSAPVNLTTVGPNHQPILPVPFSVTATTDLLNFAPTGRKVFGNFSVPFWDTNRRLRMDFAGTVSRVSLAFAGGNYLAAETGRLEAFDGRGVLLETAFTMPLGPGAQEILSITRPTADIAFAVAFARPGEGSFLRLDRLTFTPPVPEPSVLTLAAVGLLLLACKPRRCPHPPGRPLSARLPFARTRPACTRRRSCHRAVGGARPRAAMA